MTRRYDVDFSFTSFHSADLFPKVSFNRLISPLNNVSTESRIVCERETYAK